MGVLGMTDYRAETAARIYHSRVGGTPWEVLPEELRQERIRAMEAVFDSVTVRDALPPPVPTLQAPEPEHGSNPLTGGHVSYYLCPVPFPIREGTLPYQGECDDIIANLRMTFQEGCVFKAVWRSAAARLGNGKPGHSALYDAEKIVHYGRIIEKMAREALKNEGSTQ